MFPPRPGVQRPRLARCHPPGAGSGEGPGEIRSRGAGRGRAEAVLGEKSAFPPPPPRHRVSPAASLLPRAQRSSPPSGGRRPSSGSGRTGGRPAVPSVANRLHRSPRPRAGAAGGGVGARVCARRGAASARPRSVPLARRGRAAPSRVRAPSPPPPPPPFCERESVTGPTRRPPARRGRLLVGDRRRRGRSDDPGRAARPSPDPGAAGRAGAACQREMETF